MHSSLRFRCLAALAAVAAVVIPGATHAQVQVINMIPNAMSSETNGDGEPSVAVSPANPQLMAAAAFMNTPAASPVCWRSSMASRCTLS